MSDDVGVIQHALDAIPNRKTGYCTDDIARAFIVVLQRMKLSPPDERAERLATTYLAYLEHAQLSDGRFHNFMGYDRRWLDKVGSQDSCGRAIWALGYGVAHAPSESWQRACRRLLDRAAASIESLEYLRSQAFAVLGLAHAVPHDGGHAKALHYLAERLLASYAKARSGDWLWFEDILTYDNARLPEALLRAGQVLQEERFAEVGLASLGFYERVTIEDGVFVPIGNEGWYKRGRKRARYAQQPLEAYALVDAELAAFAVTRQSAHLANADRGLGWYYGKNSRGITVAAAGGGCYDGFGKATINHNMGAESTLALLAAAFTIAEHRLHVLRAVR